MVDGDDLFGNGVNVAARMEGLAETGAICVSGNVQEHIGNSLDVDLEDLGEQSVKNIDRPVRCYRVHLDSGSGPMALVHAPDAATPLTDKPSVAVLPFDNMSGDPEQEYFADGMVDEIITSLSRVHWLIVTARTSSFEYKGKNLDVREIAGKLDVRYIKAVFGRPEIGSACVAHAADPAIHIGFAGLELSGGHPKMRAHRFRPREPMRIIDRRLEGNRHRHRFLIGYRARTCGRRHCRVAGLLVQAGGASSDKNDNNRSRLIRRLINTSPLASSLAALQTFFPRSMINAKSGNLHDTLLRLSINPTGT